MLGVSPWFGGVAGCWLALHPSLGKGICSDFLPRGAMTLVSLGPKEPDTYIHIDASCFDIYIYICALHQPHPPFSSALRPAVFLDSIMPALHWKQNTAVALSSSSESTKLKFDAIGRPQKKFPALHVLNDMNCASQPVDNKCAIVDWNATGATQLFPDHSLRLRNPIHLCLAKNQGSLAFLHKSRNHCLKSVYPTVNAERALCST